MAMKTEPKKKTQTPPAIRARPPRLRTTRKGTRREENNSPTKTYGLIRQIHDGGVKKTRTLHLGQNTQHPRRHFTKTATASYARVNPLLSQLRTRSRKNKNLDSHHPTTPSEQRKPKRTTTPAPKPLFFKIPNRKDIKKERLCKARLHERNHKNLNRVAGNTSNKTK